MVAAARQERTFKPPAEFCPLCPTEPGRLATEIPYPDFDIAVFENRFPSLAKTTQMPEGGPSEVAAGVGVCEVIVYDPDHNASSSTLGAAKWRALVRVWRERTLELGSLEKTAYVLIFENRGEDVGVTLHHPHGQIYAYPFVPPYPERERAQVAAKGDILGKLLAYDLSDRRRIVLEHGSWVALVPFWARYPFEVYIVPRALRNSLLVLSEDEQDELGEIISTLTKAYDTLFASPMPYVMAVQQAPRADTCPDYRLRVEFQPRLRDKNKLKYLAGTEAAAGAFAVDAFAEEYAARLREVL
jgi:UDPglucose--hexose-1-phosphate uridylyltransferase